MKQSLLEQLRWAARMYTKEPQLLCDIMLDNEKQEGPKKEFSSFSFLQVSAQANQLYPRDSHLVCVPTPFRHYE